MHDQSQVPVAFLFRCVIDFILFYFGFYHELLVLKFIVLAVDFGGPYEIMSWACYITSIDFGGLVRAS